MALMVVLKRSASMSRVTFRVVWCKRHRVAESMASPSGRSPIVYSRSRKRRTPWIWADCQGFTVSSGPMNIS